MDKLRTQFGSVFWRVFSLFLFGLSTAQIALAQPDPTGPSNNVGSIRALIDRLLVLVNPLIALLFGFTVLVFVRGIAVFIYNAGSEEKRTEGKKFIITGLVGMFIMVGFWGIVYIIQSIYFGSGPIGSPFKI